MDDPSAVRGQKGEVRRSEHAVARVTGTPQPAAPVAGVRGERPTPSGGGMSEPDDRDDSAGEDDSATVATSPDGRFRLVVRPSEDGTSSVGEVFEGERRIDVVNRNDDSFPFLFVAHPDGHTYLVGGEDYQGQTVIELDTGARRDFLPPEASEGTGFCWVAMSFDAPTCTLVVDGCIWACPFEYRFFDFRDPMRGWPQLATDEWIPYDRRPPVFGPDGTITVHQTGTTQAERYSTDEPSAPLTATTTYRREGLALRKVGEWARGEDG